VFLIGSALSGLSQEMWQLILFRGIQGVGAGALFPIALAVIGDLFTPAERGKYQGLFTGVFGIASVLGPLVGGTLTDHLSWRAVFYVNIPFGMVAFMLLWRYFPKKTAATVKRPVDYTGAALLIGAVVPLLMALSWAGDEYAWGSFEIITMLTFAIACIFGFIFNESRVQEPIIPLTLFRSRFFAVATVLSFVSGMGLFGAINYMPMFVQGVLGTSAAHSGFVTSPMMLGMVVASTFAGILASRFGRYRPFIILGSALITGGMFMLSRLGTDTGTLTAVSAMIVMGIGIGLSMPIVNLVVQNSVAHHMLGVVSSSSQFFRQIGGTLGTAVFGTIVANRLHSNLERELGPDITAQAPPQILPDLREPQTLLSPDALERVREGFASLGPQGFELYERSVDAMRLALSDSLGFVFLAGVFITALGLLISFFMPEPSQPLRRSWGEEASDRPRETSDAVMGGEPVR
jgi:EmrB/QacA subfamily drug resistance transporter